jgi:ADP-heptose:LPS heptosyltransferase
MYRRPSLFFFKSIFRLSPDDRQIHQLLLIKKLKANMEIAMITVGGLGDVLLSTPLFKELKQQDPKTRLIVYCRRKQEIEIFKNNPYLDDIRIISFWKNPIHGIHYLFSKKKTRPLYYGGYPSLFCSSNASEGIAENLGIKLHNNRIQLYLSNAESARSKKIMAVHNNPIIVHITSRNSKNNEWPLVSWEQLVKEMPEYTFIQVGIKGESRVRGTVDLLGKYSFRQTLALLEHAHSFVGVNSSFSHATNAFNTPGVVLFGATNPELWGHPNNINLYKKWRCAPCVDLFKSNCPYSKPCMTTISVTEVKAALKQQLAHALSQR